MDVRANSRGHIKTWILIPVTYVELNLAKILDIQTHCSLLRLYSQTLCSLTKKLGKAKLTVKGSAATVQDELFPLIGLL